MKVSDQRLDEILYALAQNEGTAAANEAEWSSVAKELKQLRLRTSSQSRTSSAPKQGHTTH